MSFALWFTGSHRPTFLHEGLLALATYWEVHLPDVVVEIPCRDSTLLSDLRLVRHIDPYLTELYALLGFSTRCLVAGRPAPLCIAEWPGADFCIASHKAVCLKDLRRNSCRLLKCIL